MLGRFLVWAGVIPADLAGLVAALESALPTLEAMWAEWDAQVIA